MANGRIMIHQIAIGIVLNHIACGIPPIVKNLTPEDVAPYAPDILVTLLGQPLVTKLLRVKIMDLKRTVVNVRRIAAREEYGVMIDRLLTSINVRKHCHIPIDAFIRGYEEKIARHEVEVSCVPVKLSIKVLYTKPIVAKLESILVRNMRRGS